MNTKKIVSILLLLFVVASVGTIVAKEAGNPAPTKEMQAPVNSELPATQAAQPQKQPEATSSAKVVAYYFHGNYRCPTCRTIEAFTTEAINAGFGEDIKSGRVELKVVNVEDPRNEHYVQDYQLSNRSVVIARYQGDQQKEWKRLDEVWQLVSDKNAFVRFVQEQTTSLLNGVK